MRNYRENFQANSSKLKQTQPSSSSSFSKNNKKENTYVETSSTGECELLKIWNSNRGGLPEAKTLSPKRQKSATLRWKENPDPAYWAGVVKRLAASDFCNGGGSRGWIATFDYLLQPDTHIRVAEGAFGKQKGNPEVVEWTGLKNI